MVEMALLICNYEVYLPMLFYSRVRRHHLIVEGYSSSPSLPRIAGHNSRRGLSGDKSMTGRHFGSLHTDASISYRTSLLYGAYIHISMRVSSSP